MAPCFFRSFLAEIELEMSSKAFKTQLQTGQRGLENGPRKGLSDFLATRIRGSQPLNGLVDPRQLFVEPLPLPLKIALELRRHLDLQRALGHLERLPLLRDVDVLRAVEHVGAVRQAIGSPRRAPSESPLKAV